MKTKGPFADPKVRANWQTTNGKAGPAQKAKTAANRKPPFSKGGRPTVDRPTGRKVTLYMLPEDERRAKHLGAGNVSLGVRIALRTASSASAEEKK